MMNIRRNEIYLADMMFSDSNEIKRRPVVVLSKNKYNENEPNIITCGVSTNSIHPYHIPIKDSDVVFAKLFPDSGVRIDMINKTNKKRLLNKIGKINDEFHKKLTERLVELLG